MVKCGRIFLRRLIDLSTKVKQLNHHISLNKEAQLDIEWWIKFLPSWNGIAIIQETFINSDHINLFTDASGIGIGGFFNGHWFSVSNHQSHSIAYCELLAIVAAVFVWGSELKNKQIIVFCDNQAVGEIWKSGTCKDPSIMKLVRIMFFELVKHNINLVVQHIPGKLNIYADLLSRLQVQKFKRICPEANLDPEKIHPSIWELL